jgi:hypothetical protein
MLPVDLYKRLICDHGWSALTWFIPGDTTTVDCSHRLFLQREKLRIREQVVQRIRRKDLRDAIAVENHREMIDVKVTMIEKGDIRSYAHDG